MFRIRISLLATVCFILHVVTVSGQQGTLSDQAQVSLLTCDIGSELYSLYGHTALRIKDPVNGIDDVYNYGYFDFRTPHFYLKFVKGDLQYFVAKDQFDEFLAEYVYEQRGVYEQRLNLNAVQKQRIFDDLNAVLQSKDRFYTYKFIDRNCTTMVADVVNRNIDGKISTAIKDSRYTYRTILYGYQRPHFYENLGINIMFGSKTDNEFDHIFLPLQLMEGVNISKNGSHSLSGGTIVLNIQSAPATPASLWNNWYTYLLFLLLIVIFRNKTVYLSFFACTALLGIFLFTIGFYSFHHELALNNNVLLFNPLLLLLVYFELANKPEMALRTAYGCLCILALYAILIAGKAHFLLFLPIIATYAVLLGRIIRRNRKK